MQKLHLVGFTTDHKSLILSARRGSRSGGFVLDVDADVEVAVRAALEHHDGSEQVEEPDEIEPAVAPRQESALPVRELQARLRAGKTIESVAAAAGVDVEWVRRFAAPVLAEQTRVIEATKAATFRRARLGPSALRLGPSVYRNVLAKGLALAGDDLDGGWSTRQIAEGRWLVTFSYVSRNRKQKASWELDLRTGEVQANDRLAGELAFVPGAPRPASPSVTTTKPTKVPASSLPSDADRANAKRVAQARKAAEAQLADAVRKGTKRSVEVARRGVSPTRPAGKAAAPRPAPAPAPAPEEASTPVRTRRQPVEIDGPLFPVEAPGFDELDDAAVFDPATFDAGVDDPGVAAVAMVRQAAEALLSDFHAGRLNDDDLAEAPEGLAHLVVAEDIAEGNAAEGMVDEGGDAVGDEGGDEDGDEPIEAPIPEPVEAAVDEPTVEPVTDVVPVVPAPSPLPRSLVRAAERIDVPAPEASRRLRVRKHDERVVRTPIDLEVIGRAGPGAPSPRFRDDLVAPAARNGDAPAPGAPAHEVAPADDTAPGAPAAPPRRRRSAPLRAR